MSDDARAKVDPPPALAGSGPKVNADELQFEALATFVRADFWCFVELMFAVLYPGQKLVYAGYLKLIATVLMRSCSHVLDADRGTSARWRLHASPMPPYSMERISSSWSPARTISPAALPIRARATGETYEIDPFRGIRFVFPGDPERLEFAVVSPECHPMPKSDRAELRRLRNTAPAYLQSAMSFGELMVVVGAFNQVQSSLRWFVDNFSSIADWRATLLRVATFRKAIVTMDELGQTASRINIAEAEGRSIQIDDLHIASPAGCVMLSETHANLDPGERVLITGESGEEKALLFRTIGGLWPWGSGRITHPAARGKKRWISRVRLEPEPACSPIARHCSDQSIPSLRRRRTIGRYGRERDEGWHASIKQWVRPRGGASSSAGSAVPDRLQPEEAVGQQCAKERSFVVSDRAAQNDAERGYR